ncbi:hypothetical protein WISP_142319 [Willisornis vidua]|uniref:Uncharacterized protein n=1 Tax=Willisornis vidua TaxID=1566151 RepID=A0ABQ9CSD0_9PASS|nr:hypothetical protein WISP_142319 [Willisornis vidua]
MFRMSPQVPQNPATWGSLWTSQVGVNSIKAMLMRTQLRWAGHVSRMGDHHLQKIVLYGELAAGCCKRGAPKRRYKDSLKLYLSHQ